MCINREWLDDWYDGGNRVLLGYDDDYEYYLCCNREGDDFVVRIDKVESTSGEKWLFLCDEWVGWDVEAARKWGEYFGNKWMAEFAE